jgi:hypothetical protein
VVTIESTAKDKRRNGVISVSNDSIADVALQTHQTTKITAALRCDVCNSPIEGEPTGRGLLMWTRGGEVRLDEEPALCANCSTAIGVTALAAWNVEEDEG